jgi:hypothetical protein
MLFKRGNEQFRRYVKLLEKEMIRLSIIKNKNR